MPADDFANLAEDPDTGDLFALSKTDSGGWMVQRSRVGVKGSWLPTSYSAADKKAALELWLKDTKTPTARRFAWRSDAAYITWREEYERRQKAGTL